MSQDHSYYAARAIQERRLAMAATNDAARNAHLKLASEYDRLAGAAGPPPEGAADESEQRTG